MRYEVIRYRLEKTDHFEISQSDFQALRDIKQKLLITLNIEEKFSILLENYAEFEKEVLSATVDGMIFHKSGWSEATALIHTFNRRLVNLLTASRLYLDHVCHDLNVIYAGDRGAAQQINAERNTQYDARLGYRAMEALRNYVQHRGLPVYSVEHVIRQNDKAAPPHVENIISLYLNTRRLKEDGGFKAAVLEELSSRGEKLDLKPLVRQYMSGLGEVHKEVRRVLSEDVKRWETVFNAFQEKYAVSDAAVRTLYVVAKDDDREIIEEVQIFSDLLDRRHSLERRTMFVTHYEGHIATSQPSGPEPRDPLLERL